jgi:hypothetical protein
MLYEIANPAAIATRQMPSIANGAPKPARSTIAGAMMMKPTSMMFASGTTIAL